MPQPSPAPARTPREALVWLRTPEAIRARCARIRAAAAGDALAHFRLDAGALEPVADYVAEVIRARHPDLRVPMHSRWRHFDAGGIERWPRLAREAGLDDARERARVRIDLVVTSVLLDAGAGDAWRYLEPGTGTEYRRSEGLAVASLHLFGDGTFAGGEGRAPRADAAGLAGVDAGRLAAGLQVTDANPLVGLEGRAALLQRLADALRASPALFGTDPPRPGHLFDALAGRADDAGRVSAASVLALVLEGLGDIWPGRLRLAGANLGDVWRHPRARGEAGAGDDASAGLVPFHKLSQWLAYSLVEALEDGGLAVTGLDRLTGLPEYRNGGLLVDLGALVPRHAALLETPQPVDAEAVVEWRALTVALLDEVAQRVRARLGLDARVLPLASVLEGGTWAAGRRIAAERRAGGPPPIHVESDGTVF